MKKELIRLASDKGFKSSVIGKSVESTVSDKPFYYLWLCELQKWLRDNHGEEIMVEPVWNNLQMEKTIYAPWRLYTKQEVLDGVEDEKPEYYDTYEQALEIELFKALDNLKV